MQYKQITCIQQKNYYFAPAMKEVTVFKIPVLSKAHSVVRLLMQSFIKCSFVIACLLLASCKDMGTARFIIRNKSSSGIDSLYFMPSDADSRHYLNLVPGEEQQYNLSMAGQSTDGAYGIVFNKNNKNIYKVFGYFSHGAAMEKHTIVEIRDDTLIFKPKY